MSSPATPRIIVVIPSRYDSHRLPGKPLADIGGVPMIVRVARQACRAQTVSEVVVATDDERIRSVVEKAGFRAVMTSRECPSGTDRIAEAVLAEGAAQIVVNVQGDEPLIPPAMIDQAVQPLLEDSAIDVGTLVKKIHAAEDLRNPSIIKVVLDRHQDCLYFSRSPIPYLRDSGGDEWIEKGTWYRHIGLYVFRKDFLSRFPTFSPTPLERMEKLEQLRILEHGFHIRAVITELESVAVDTPEDLERVRAMIALNPR